MGRQSIYVQRLLTEANKHACTSRDVATLLDLTISRAAFMLRYYERVGYLVASRRARATSIYRITASGRDALASAGKPHEHDARELSAAMRLPMSTV